MSVFKLLQMTLLNILSFAILIFMPLGAFAQDGLSQESAVESYQMGLKSYQAKDYKSARDQFHAAWRLEPKNALVLYNWGLSEFKLGNEGMALAAWRKALFLNPDLFAATKAMDYLLSVSSIGNVQSSQSHWEFFRQKVLNHVSMNQTFILSILLLLAAGWTLIRYFGRRHIAVNEELPLPPIPWTGIGFALIFVISQTIAILKVIDHFAPRATVIESSVAVMSAPTPDSSTLFEIYEGSEVLLKKKVSKWTQVKYPGGLSGWVKNQSIFHTSGREL